MPNMNSTEMVNILKKYQSNKYVHPLTCRSSGHALLIPYEEDGKVVLKCPDCDYIQKVKTLSESFIAMADYEYKFPPEFKKRMEELKHE